MYEYFSHNGKLLPASQATVLLDDIEYSYGFGVYETIRVNHGKAVFGLEHCQRLMKSAGIIKLEHPFNAESVHEYSAALLKKLSVEACNLKILLIGAPSKERANLYIQALNPMFPNRKLYTKGAHCITVECERQFPNAKTLNMLPSYLAYRKAKAADVYDALLINRTGNITEGTRTNFFGLIGKEIYSAPEVDILLGVTRHHVLKVAKRNGFSVKEQPIKLGDFANFDSAFLTSTSTKIMPIHTVDDHEWKQISAELQLLMSAFDDFLDSYR